MRSDDEVVSSSCAGRSSNWLRPLIGCTAPVDLQSVTPVRKWWWIKHREDFVSVYHFTVVCRIHMLSLR